MHDSEIADLKAEVERLRKVEESFLLAELKRKEGV